MDDLHKVGQTDGCSMISVIIPRIGLYVTYHGNPYVVLSTETHQEESPETGQGVLTFPKAEFTTFCRILPIDAEGEDISTPDNPVITVRAEDFGLI